MAQVLVKRAQLLRSHWRYSLQHLSLGLQLWCHLQCTLLHSRTTFCLAEWVTAFHASGTQSLNNQPSIQAIRAAAIPYTCGGLRRARNITTIAGSSGALGTTKPLATNPRNHDIHLSESGLLSLPLCIYLGSGLGLCLLVPCCLRGSSLCFGTQSIESGFHVICGHVSRRVQSSGSGSLRTETFTVNIEPSSNSGVIVVRSGLSRSLRCGLPWLC